MILQQETRALMWVSMFHCSCSSLRVSEYDYSVVRTNGNLTVARYVMNTSLSKGKSFMSWWGSSVFVWFSYQSC